MRFRFIRGRWLITGMVWYYFAVMGLEWGASWKKWVTAELAHIIKEFFT